MQLISEYKKEIMYLLRAIDLFSKYAFVVPLKDKKAVAIANAFEIVSIQTGGQIKYWLIKTVNFIRFILETGSSTITNKWIQHLTNESQSLQRGLLELEKKFTSLKQVCQKNFILNC